MTPSSPPSPRPSDSQLRPHILIVGGGIGGLTLAILLEHARISYTVLERSTSVRLLGSAIALGPGVLPLFEQIGILEEIEKQSRPVARGMVWSEKLVPIMDLDHRATQKRYGFLTRVISRPTLYQILLSKVPAEKMHMGKKIVSMTQPSMVQEEDERQKHQYPVSVSCADGSEFYGDIVVGADGAYSAIRQLLYQQIEDDFNSASVSPTSQAVQPLPASDKEQLSFTSTCLVGQTRPDLDIRKFNFVHGPDCRVGSIIGDNKPFSWSVFSMPDESICWMVTEHLNETLPSPAVSSVISTSRPASPVSQVSTASPPSPVSPTESVSSCDPSSPLSSVSDETYLSSEWGPHKVEMMCNRVGKFPIPCGPGLMIQDLIENTDKEKISKVMLEEKLFETWSYGRVVLLGDACHKMHPSAGLGAVAAIQDAAVLSDLLFHLPTNASPQDISNAFQSYREDRYPIALQSYEARYQMSHLNEQSWISNFIRKVMNNLPKWIWYRALDRLYEYRPQVSFLSKVDDRGEVPPLPQSFYYSSV
ncbi:hypothetical protein BGX28_009071 [Mortierella sp. GBA30]|nr:hypothetical protein BGX28_009071 [Mortierella sp. GBA30]